VGGATVKVPGMLGVGKNPYSASSTA